MAMVRNCRFQNLKLSLPQPSTTLLPSCFPIATTTTTPTTVTSFTSNIVSAYYLNKINVLGSGNSGTVYKVSHKTTSEIFALKKVKEDMDPTSRRQLLREIEILRLVHSPYIVKCEDIFQNPSEGEVSILMEYMDHGTLESLRGKVVTEEQLAVIARQVLKGLYYLHELKIVHRDIKPANLLRNSKEEVKIADFGVSKIIVKKSLDKCNSFVGTCAYMSPERLNSDYADHEDESNVYAGDIWSFGLTMLEILVGYFPLLPQGQKPDWAAVMCAVCFDEPPKAPEECSQEFKSFIGCCLRKKPSERWTASQLLSHPFLTRPES